MIHFTILLAIYYLFYKPQFEKKAIAKTKITLNLNQIKTSPPPTKPTPKPNPINSPINPPPKTPPPPKKEIKKSKEVSAPKKSTQKVSKSGFIAKKSEENRTKKVKIDTKPKKVKVAKKQKSKKITKTKLHSKKPTQKVAKRRVRPKGPNAHLINSLYGSSYSKMSSLQRRFIDRNLRKILIISQQTLNYLGYPKEARIMGQSGTNVVEFWLYPNGDIRGLRLKRKIGASSLDRQTIEVIKTAYMYYPHPPVKTKIIIYVKYQLY